MWPISKSCWSYISDWVPPDAKSGTRMWERVINFAIAHSKEAPKWTWGSERRKRRKAAQGGMSPIRMGCSPQSSPLAMMLPIFSARFRDVHSPVQKPPEASTLPAPLPMPFWAGIILHHFILQPLPCSHTGIFLVLKYSHPLILASGFCTYRSLCLEPCYPGIAGFIPKFSA